MLLTALNLGYVSCANDPKAANDANFRRALQDFFNSGPDASALCVPPVWADVYTTTDINAAHDRDVVIITEQENLQLLALAKAGLLSVRRSIHVVSYPAASFRVPTRYYSETSAGIKVEIEKTVGSASGLVKQRCFQFATIRLVDVDNFTVPAASNGAYISTVTYRIEATSIPAWAKSPSVAKTFPDVSLWLLHPVRQQQAPFHLTEHGWAIGG